MAGKDSISKRLKWAAVFVLIAAAVLIAWQHINRDSSINSFDECVAAGNPVMESYPEQCSSGGRTFVNPKQLPPL